MGTEIELPPDMATVVRTKVREVLFASLPDAEVDRLVQAERDEFFVPKTKDRYGNDIPSYQRALTPFQLLVRRELEQQCAPTIKRIVEEAVKTEWKGSEQVIVGDLVKKLAPAVLEGVMEGMVAKALTALKSGY